ncbi:MAG: glycosyltransferase family 2 protein [Actinomycetota bacterium]
MVSETLGTLVIEIPKVGLQRVSVVMVTFGHWDWVSSALEALVRETPPVFEAIVVDNAHPDGTGERLEREVTGAKIIRNETNAGFGPACNQGASAAKGEFLCFLNSDVLVTNGWLDPLIAALEDEAAGAAVPCLLNLDGTIQDAGALVGSDGRTVALGAGGDPLDFAYRFPRDVDYGSAACLLVRRPVFESLGGFDPVYEIGYCEDVDFGFRLAEQGLVARYEPRSRVLHAGGASSAPEVVERLVERNTRVLRERWRRELALRPSLVGWEGRPDVVVAARDAEALDRFLVIVDRIPSLDAPEGRLVETMLTEWPRSRVTILSPAAPGAELADHLLDLGAEIVCDPEDDSAWFEARLFHYSVVVDCVTTSEKRFAHLVERTQPQAFVADGSLLADDPGPIAETMARFGVAPASAA